MRSCGQVWAMGKDLEALGGKEILGHTGDDEYEQYDDGDDEDDYEDDDDDNHDDECDIIESPGNGG